MTSAAAGRVLITGGAGFLGINLTRYLLNRGYDVTSLDIASYDYPDTRDRVRVVTGDIRNLAKVTEAMDGADFVVHTAAALPLYKPDDIYTTDVEGTRKYPRLRRDDLEARFPGLLDSVL